MNALLALIGALCVLSLTGATQVKECGSAQEVTDANKYRVSSCDSPPCKLKKRTNVTAEFKFVATEDTDQLNNDVYARISGIPFPFVGVHGKNACPNIKDLEGKPGCPLKAGKEYLYENAFYVYEIYPKINVLVQWALINPKTQKKELCVIIPSKITS